MLEEFLHQHEIDIAMLQEVVCTTLSGMRNYESYLNIGTNMRGTAILVKNGIEVGEVKRLPTGRGIAAHILNKWFINVYAPSGAEKKAERERFYTTDMATLLPESETESIMGGDFNCVINRNDTTTTFQTSRALKELLCGLQFVDAWDQNMSPTYTHYTPTGATRLDRIYITPILYQKKTGIGTMAAAFTDHFAVVLRMELDGTITRRGPGVWKMNVSLFKNKSFMGTIQQMWARCTRRRKDYPNVVMWWVRNVQRAIKWTFIREGADQRRDRKAMENTYYEAIYEVLASETDAASKKRNLKYLKEQIINLNGTTRDRLKLDGAGDEEMEEENPSLYQLIRSRRRQKMRHIQHVRDPSGEIQTGTTGIMQTFNEHLRSSFAPIAVHAGSMEEVASYVTKTLTPDANDTLEAPITIEELRKAVLKGKRRKAPGMDGISQDFFREAWEVVKTDMLTIIQTMYTDGIQSMTQKLGIIVCIPKIPAPSIPEEYRYLTMLNADIKLLTRIIAARMNMWMPDLLHPSQHCGIQGRNIFDAIATIRDVVAYAEYDRKALCIVSLDFAAAFDRISHQYLYQMIDRYGFGAEHQQRIRNLYEGATARISINGNISTPIQIGSGVRQGCPLSGILFALALNPFLSMIAEQLPGIKIGSQGASVATVAYADDVTVFLTSQQDVEKLLRIIAVYEKASGAQVNVKKSTALAMGGWSKNISIGKIPYREEAKILGVRFTGTVKRSAEITWAPIVNSIKATAKEAYGRNLTLDTRIRYIHTYLLARVWFAAQIIPMTTTCIRQIRTAVTWFLWHGAIFRLAYATIRRPKQEGGWGLMDIEAKSRALLHCRLAMQGRGTDPITIGWLNRWLPPKGQNNPPDLRGIPVALPYIREYIQDTAYIEMQREGETGRMYKRRVYSSMTRLLSDTTGGPRTRVESYWPDTNWKRVWKNVHTTPGSETLKAQWYQIIHDLIPTNVRLKKIRLSNTDECRVCGGEDTLSHRMTECGEGQLIWRWTRARIAGILRMESRYIPESWLLRPDFQLWPPQRHGAVLWMISQMATYQTISDRTLTKQDYLDFLRRARWKTVSNPATKRRVGNYLSVLDE
jgi:exonuclease III